jgi:uncharacterized YccA/Bax inhibitor family protein
MFGSHLQSSNPALNNGDAFEQFYGALAQERPTTATLQGVVNKTAILLGLAIVAGAGGYAMAPVLGVSGMVIASIATLIIVLGVYYKIAGNPMHAVFLAPVYAVVEGFFLGALTSVLDRVLAGMQIAAAGSLALQAFVITVAVMLAMLGLYYARILKPTRTFAAVVSTLTVGIMLTYLVSFVVSFFGVTMPLISVWSGMNGGAMAWAGLGLNVLILGVAAMWLIMDFKLIEDKVNEGAPRAIEWYCGFALIVTLAWIYFEAVKIAFRLAILLNNRH